LYDVLLGIACSDPSFVGLRGQKYQVHGVDHQIYNLISDPLFQLNSRFMFLSESNDCPIIPSTGRTAHQCFTHPGSYLGNLALRTLRDDRLLIESGDANGGFSMVQWNGRDLTLPTNNSVMEMISSHEITLHLDPLFTIRVENIDGFLNLASVVFDGMNLAMAGNLSTHGLFGQTWKNARYKSTLKVIEGEVDDYTILDNDLFGTSFPYNRFNQ